MRFCKEFVKDNNKASSAYSTALKAIGLASVKRAVPSWPATGNKHCCSISAQFSALD
jgi:hypothetical protein